MSLVEASPAQRAFEAAAATLRDDYIAALERAVRARRTFKAAHSIADAEAAQVELNAAVAELRSFHGEIDDQVAA